MQNLKKLRCQGNKDLCWALRFGFPWFVLVLLCSGSLLDSFGSDFFAKDFFWLRLSCFSK